MKTLDARSVKEPRPPHARFLLSAPFLAASLLVGGLSPTKVSAAANQAGASHATGRIATPFGERRLAQRMTCKSVSSCEEAVRLWCGGYSRADGDNDGIPCETVCSSKREVDEIRARIGC